MKYQIKELSKEELTELYETNLKQDFPVSEIKPLWHITKSMEEQYGMSLGIYEGTDLRAYGIFILPKDYHAALIDYFAVVSAFRGQGIGHSSLELIRTYFQAGGGLDRLYIECESPASTADKAEQKTRSRRISFYESMGCQKTDCMSNVFGVEYEIFHLPVSSAPAPGSAREELDTIYRTMFRPKHYANNVSIRKL